MKSLEELKQIRDRVKDQVDRQRRKAGSFRTGRRGAETASEKRDRDTDRMYRAVPVRADRRGV